jgi:hydrogenase/urease accessory protein HupE
MTSAFRVLRALAMALCLIFVLTAGRVARAHELRPALLELTAQTAETWQARFHVPMQGELRLRLALSLPAGCRELTTRRGTVQGPMHVEEARFFCAGGLAARELTITGLDRTFTDVLVHIQHPSGTVQTARILATHPRLTVEREPTVVDVAKTYAALGVEHILLGWDHLAFVVALVLLVGEGRRLLLSITAFTAAHSVTLAAATLGWLFVPTPPVEATIALSVVFVAAEVARRQSGQRSLTARNPWVVAFVFGLLHGLGFAGALANVGLPASAIPTSLLFFNLGVELGQLAFVALCLGALAAVRRFAGHGAAHVRWSAYALGAIASFWTIERVSDFWM